MKKIKKRTKKKKRLSSKLFISTVSLLNLIYAIVVRIYDRKQVIKVLQDSDTYETIVRTGKEQRKG